MKKVKIKISVHFGISPFSSTWQDKSFNDIESAIMWCRKNYKKIWCINDFRTFGRPISHFDVMDAINGVCN